MDNNQQNQIMPNGMQQPNQFVNSNNIGQIQQPMNNQNQIQVPQQPAMIPPEPVSNSCVEDHKDIELGVDRDYDNSVEIGKNASMLISFKVKTYGKTTKESLKEAKEVFHELDCLTADYNKKVFDEIMKSKTDKIAQTTTKLDKKTVVEDLLGEDISSKKKEESDEQNIKLEGDEKENVSTTTDE